MPTYIVALSLSLVFVVLNAARINSIKQDDLHRGTQEESAESILGALMRRDSNARKSSRWTAPGFSATETFDDVRGDMERSLAKHNDFARLIVVDGSVLKRGGSVNLTDPHVTLNGEDLREQAVALLISQSAVSGLPEGEENEKKLHEGLQKASRVVMVLRKEGPDRWVVKALSAMKNRGANAKWCEAGYIVVDPGMQGKKVGSILWRALRVVAMEMNVEAFFTETMLSNVASLKLQRHNCVEVLVVGLFTEKSACSKFPDRPDLQLLVMLFPLVSTSDIQLRLHGILAAIRGMYQTMKDEGNITTWLENPNVANNNFLDYQEVVAAVDGDPTLDEAWDQGKVRQGGKTWASKNEWKTEFTNSISKELGVAIPEKATAQLQIRSLAQPTPMRESTATRWNNKVIIIGGVSLIAMNCVLFGSALYFRMYPRSDSGEDVSAIEDKITEDSETITST